MKNPFMFVLFISAIATFAQTPEQGWELNDSAGLWNWCPVYYAIVRDYGEQPMQQSRSRNYTFTVREVLSRRIEACVAAGYNDALHRHLVDSASPTAAAPAPDEDAGSVSRGCNMQLEIRNSEEQDWILSIICDNLTWIIAEATQVKRNAIFHLRHPDFDWLVSEG